MKTSSPVISSGIRDNYKRGVVAEFLKFHIKENSRLSVVSAFFTIYAHDLLKDWLDRINHMDFLFGEPRFVGSLDLLISLRKRIVGWCSACWTGLSW